MACEGCLKNEHDDGDDGCAVLLSDNAESPSKIACSVNFSKMFGYFPETLSIKTSKFSKLSIFSISKVNNFFWNRG